MPLRRLRRPATPRALEAVAPPAAPGARRTLANVSPRAQLRGGRLPQRFLQLFVGLTLFGASVALLVRSNLGTAPWDVLHQGVANHTALTIGQAAIALAIPILLLWIPLKQWPGIGTVANAIWIGLAADAFLALIPTPSHLVARIGFVVLGLLAVSLGGALYIGAQFGPGPRDGLMTGFAARTGFSHGTVRTVIEVSVLLLGLLLGGTAGIGTIVLALGIGPLTQLFLPWCIVELRER